MMTFWKVSSSLMEETRDYQKSPRIQRKKKQIEWWKWKVYWIKSDTQRMGMKKKSVMKRILKWLPNMENTDKKLSKKTKARLRDMKWYCTTPLIQSSKQAKLILKQKKDWLPVILPPPLSFLLPELRLLPPGSPHPRTVRWCRRTSHSQEDSLMRAQGHLRADSGSWAELQGRAGEQDRTGRSSDHSRTHPSPLPPPSPGLLCCVWNGALEPFTRYAPFCSSSLVQHVLYLFLFTEDQNLAWRQPACISSLTCPISGNFSKRLAGRRSVWGF